MSEISGASLRTADALINALIENGVENFFIVTGGNAMFLHDAIRISGATYTTFQHEQAAAMAADVYSRVSGKVSACVVTSGPAVSNLTTGVAGAFLDSSPVIFISGQSKSSEIRSEEMGSGVRQFGTFELPGVELLKPICKKSLRLTADLNPFKVIADLVQDATSGRPGPVFLEVPLDLQSALANLEGKSLASAFSQEWDSVDPNPFVHGYLSALKFSKKPLILAGYGVISSREHERLRILSRSLGIPLVTTQLAKEVVPYDSDSFVGHVGIRGDRAGNLAVFESDCLLVIGCSLQQQTIGYVASDFAPNAKIFLVDFENSVSAKKLEIDFEQIVNCSVRELLDSIMNSSEDQVSVPAHVAWGLRVLELKKEFAVSNEPHKIGPGRINLYSFVDALNEFTDFGDVVITDAGLSFYVMGQAFRLKLSQNYVVSGGLGSMGFALPGAIGASLTRRDRVIAVTGDGSLQMNVQELATLSKAQNPVFVFVINNEGYASIRNSQRSFFGPDLIGSSNETGLGMPDWESIAKGYSLQYLRIEDEGSLRSKLDQISKCKQPILIEVMCQVNQEIMPLVSSVRSVDGKLVSNPLHVMSPLHKSDVNLFQQN